MCQLCQQVDPSKATEVAGQYRRSIKDTIGLLEDLLKICGELEDEYRLIGFFYHTTEYETRKIMAGIPDPAEILVHLEDYFELAEPAEYDLWANRINVVVEHASKLRADVLHIPRQAKVEQLIHKYDQVIDPAVRALLLVVKSERAVLAELASYVNHLRKISMYAQEDLEFEDRVRPWWCFNYNDWTKEPELENEGQEWDTFVDWVSCLPETRKAVEKGEQVRDIALRWIWREDDVLPNRLLIFEDGKVF